MRIRSLGALLLFAIVLLVFGATSCGKFFVGKVSGGGAGGGGFLYVANSGGQSISVLNINSSAGALASVSGSPFSTTAAPKVLAIDPQNRFLFVGMTSGGIEVFTVNSDGSLSQVANGGSAASGTTPIANTVTPGGTFLYVLDTISNNVSAFSIGSNGALTAAQGTPFPANSSPGPGLAVDRTGSHLYAAAGTVGIFSGTINSQNGSLSQTGTTAPPSGGSVQSLAITPSGSFLYASDPSNGVLAYRVNADGTLTVLHNNTAFAAGKSPVALSIDPSNRFVLVVNNGDSNVSSFAILSDGTLTPVSGSPFPAGSSPQAITFDRSGKFVYVAGSTGVAVFVLDSTTLGKLNSQGTTAAGTNPVSIVASH